MTFIFCESLYLPHPPFSVKYGGTGRQFSMSWRPAWNTTVPGQPRLHGDIASKTTKIKPNPTPQPQHESGGGVPLLSKTDLLENQMG